MNRIIVIAAALAALGAPALASADWPTPAEVLFQAKIHAAAMPIPAALPAGPLIEVKSSEPRTCSGWQTIAHPKNLSPRGPHGSYWTHHPYPTPKAAEDAAIEDCERQNLGYACTADRPWRSHNCR